MPPQPLSSFNTKVGIVPDAAKLSERPILAQLIAIVIATWADVDVALGEMLNYFLDGDHRHTTAVYLALRSGQPAAIRAAAESCLSTDELGLFEIIFSLAGRAKSARDKIAHGLWGIHPKVPENLVWVNPRSKLTHLAGLTTRRRKGPKEIPTMGPYSPEGMLVYSQKDLEEIVEQCKRAGYLVRWFTRMVETTNDAKQKRLFETLMSEPDVASEIRQREMNRQKNPPKRAG